MRETSNRPLLCPAALPRRVTRLLWRTPLLLCSLPAFCIVVADGQSPAKPLPALSAEEIAGRVEAMNARRAAALLGYVDRREMTLTYKGLLTNRRARELVEMRFTAPASKRFTVLSSSGSPLLRDGVFQREMDNELAAMDPQARREAALTPANYHLTLLGQQHLPEGDCYLLEVSPKTSSRFAYSGKVWIESPDFAVVRIEGRPAQNPSFWVRDGEFTAQYGKIGDFWLPQQTASSSHIRLGGEASFTIQFGSYQLLNALPLTAEAAH